MINFSPKSKLSKKPAKKARKTRSSVPIRPPGYFALTPEDIAEMNMFAWQRQSHSSPQINARRHKPQEPEIGTGK